MKPVISAVATMILVPAALAVMSPPAKGDEFSAANGAWYLYKRNCSGCHGFQGQGIPPVGPPLMGNAFLVNAPPDAVEQVIRNGREGADKVYGEYLQDGQVGYMSMPAFESDVISNTELDLLVTYLKGGFQQGQFNQ